MSEIIEVRHLKKYFNILNKKVKDICESSNISKTTLQCVRKGKIATEFIENEILPLDSKLCYRAIGLAIGIDFSALGGDKISKAVMNKCFELGVIAERVGRDNAVLKLMPALTIEDDVLLEGLQIVRNAIKACL